MGNRHPEAGASAPLVMRWVEHMPIRDRMLPFISMNETSVCTIETEDSTGAKRGAIALGIARHDLPNGFAVHQTIAEAEAIVALLQNAIDDAKRIEAGIAPLAPISDAPPVKH